MEPRTKFLVTVEMIWEGELTMREIGTLNLEISPLADRIKQCIMVATEGLAQGQADISISEEKADSHPYHEKKQDCDCLSCNIKRFIDKMVDKKGKEEGRRGHNDGVRIADLNSPADFMEFYTHIAGSNWFENLPEKLLYELLIKSADMLAIWDVSKHNVREKAKFEQEAKRGIAAGDKLEQSFAAQETNAPEGEKEKIANKRTKVKEAQVKLRAFLEKYFPRNS